MTLSTSFPDWLQQGLDAFMSGRVEDWMQLYASDAVHEFPLAREGSPRRLEGRAAITAHLAKVPEFVRFGHFSEVRVREAGTETIVEAKGHHWRKPGDEPFTLIYVWFITREGGKITYFRDYMSELA